MFNNWPKFWKKLAKVGGVVVGVACVISAYYAVRAYHYPPNPPSQNNTTTIPKNEEARLTNKDSKVNNHAGSDSNLTVNAPTQNINVLYNNGRINQVTQKGSAIERKKEKTEATATQSPAKRSRDALETLKVDFRNQYSDIDLCDAEDRQKNVPKFRQAYAEIQEIRGIAVELNDMPSMNWVKEITCNGSQKSGGIETVGNNGVNRSESDTNALPENKPQIITPYPTGKLIKNPDGSYSQITNY